MFIIFIFITVPGGEHLITDIRGSSCVDFDSVFPPALFNHQLLYERQIAVRMDKWVDPILQEIPTRMPSGLKSLGVGFGPGGLPLLNIAQISSRFCYFCCVHL